jgi:four helix bundle protein
MWEDRSAKTEVQSIINMKPGFKFEKLTIWQNSMNLADETMLLSAEFPKKESFNLTSQICRAADTVALNISERSILQSNPEQKKFVGYAIRSLAEVVTCLHKGKRRDYISVEQFNKLYLDSYNLMNMIIGFRNQIK